MEVDDESSSFPVSKPGLQKPGGNKSLRSDSDEQNEINLQTTYRQNKASNIGLSNQQITSSDRNNFPPIIIEFIDKHNKSDCKLIDELVKAWKHTNNKDTNVIERYGFRHILLIFAGDLSTFDDLLNKSLCANKLDEREFKIKFPTRLHELYSLVIKAFQLTWNENEIIDDLKVKYTSLLNLTRLVAHNGRLLKAVRADFSSSKYVR